MTDNIYRNDKQRRVNSSTPAFDPNMGYLQPQSEEIERLVLGALMIDKDAYTIVSEILRPETFYNSRNQKIFAAIQTLSIHEHPVDIVTVTEQLKRDGTLEEVGGQMYVFDLTVHAVSSSNVEYHSRILAQKYLARQLISFGSQVVTQAFDEGNDIELVMQGAEGRLFEISQKNMRKDYTSLAPVVKNALDILQNAANNQGGLTGVSSGYVVLDDITSGWQKSDLVILAGRPAMGKTAFALSIAKNVAVDCHVPTAFFSLEMSNLQLVNRLISNVCEIEGKKLLNGHLDNDEWERIDKNVRLLDEAPLYLDDTPGLSIFELRTKARRLVREQKVELIIIDYLQLMNANGMRFGNRQEEVSTISRSLKSLAKELNIPIIALSQLNRSVEQRDNDGGKRPQLSDLRESGAIEQDADMVLFVHRPEYYHILKDENGVSLIGMAQIIIAKHRKGAVGEVLLKFSGDYTRFSNIEDSYEPSSTMDEVPPPVDAIYRYSKFVDQPDNSIKSAFPRKCPF